MSFNSGNIAIKICYTAYFFNRKRFQFSEKYLYLHCVFHGIRFKVSNEDWLSVKMAFFYAFNIWIKVNANTVKSITFVLFYNPTKLKNVQT